MLNHIIIMGRLVRDPELRRTGSGVAVASFRVAVDRDYAPKDGGERKADFIDCVAWRQSAEFISRYFHKGSMIIVEGSLRNDNYTDNNGVKQYRMNVQVDNVTFGESKSASQGGGGQQGGYGNYAPNQPAPQQYQQPYQQAAAAAQAVPQQSGSLSVGDLGEFEEILSDGEVPF